jgi:acetamidase/formamidase
VSVVELQADAVHYTWSARHEPRLRIAPGDTLEVTTRDGFDGQLAGLAADALEDSIDVLDFGRIAPLTGPVWVEGAQPGDALSIEILSLEPQGPGWAVVWPAWAQFDFHRPAGVGPRGSLMTFDAGELASGSVAIGGVDVPLSPMLGIVGTAPAAGEFATLPPRDFGGNMDCRLVREGATLLLPVFVEGGRVSFGDGHAVQGDGEISTTGLECGMRATVVIGLERGRHLGGPELRTPTSRTVIEYGHDLGQAARRAIERTHAALVAEGLDGLQAYALLGLAGQLAINEVVDMPHVGVRLTVPLGGPTP